MNRRILFAVLGLSVLLHLAIFWPGPERGDGLRSSAPPLIVQLPHDAKAPIEHEKTPARQRAGEEVQAQPLAEARRAALVEDADSAKSERPAPSLTTRPSPRERAARQQQLSLTSPQALEVKENTASTAERPQDAASQPQSRQHILSLAAYRLALATAAVHLAAAQPAAPELQGTATVEVSLLAGQSLARVSLAQSSGSEVVDKLALELLSRAAALLAERFSAEANESLRLPVEFGAMAVADAVPRR